MSDNRMSEDRSGLPIAAPSIWDGSRLQMIVRFLWTLRARKAVVIRCFGLCCLIGCVYYVTATRLYESDAKLLVLQMGNEALESGPDRTRAKDMMPTYVEVIVSDEVLSRTIAQLTDEQRIDLAGLPRHEWIAELRKRFRATVARETNVLNLSYRSKSPKASAAVLNAILTAYIGFMNKTHQGTSQESENTNPPEAAARSVVEPKKRRADRVEIEFGGVYWEQRRRFQCCDSTRAAVERRTDPGAGGNVGIAGFAGFAESSRRAG